MSPQPHAGNESGERPASVPETAFTIDEAAEQLALIRDVAHAVGMAMSGHVIAVGDFDAKIRLAHDLYAMFDFVEKLGTRLDELALGASRRRPARQQRLDLLDRLFVGDLPDAFLGRCYGVALPSLRELMAAYARRTDALLDAPSLRTLRQGTLAIDEMIASQPPGDVPPDDEGAALAALVRRPAPAKSAVGARPPRARSSARDSRLTTFGQTRRYTVDDVPGIDPLIDPFEMQRIVMLRIQRDELDAVETFANAIYDSDALPDADLLLLARLASDEARHAAIGQRELARLGIDPFTVPCGTIGIDVRTALPPDLALMQINLFGEIHQVRELSRFARQAEERGDTGSARAFGFVFADEMMHVRRGRTLLRRLARENGLSLRALEDRARDAAVDRLRTLGVVGEDYENSLSDQAIARIVGE